MPTATSERPVTTQAVSDSGLKHFQAQPALQCIKVTLPLLCNALWNSQGTDLGQLPCTHHLVKHIFSRLQSAAVCCILQ